MRLPERLSVWERAEKLISIAHPDFRDELIREAEKQHIWYRHKQTVTRNSKERGPAALFFAPCKPWKSAVY